MPQCLKKILNEKQMQIAEEFMNNHRVDIDTLDCCMTSQFTFEITASGIGDSIYIVCGEDRIWLDDGLES